MTTIPRSLERVLLAAERQENEHVDAAWASFVQEYSRLLLHVARSVTSTEDDAMDAYAFVLEQLRADDYRRLRDFASQPRSKLSTWMVVVTRRLCLDLYRHRYGRRRGDESREQLFVRRRLQDLISSGVEPDELPAPRSGGAELAIRQSELQAGLERALATIDARDRLLIRLRFEDDLTAQEIARILDLQSPFHVYRRINVILTGLRRTLQRAGIRSAFP